MESEAGRALSEQALAEAPGSLRVVLVGLIHGQNTLDCLDSKFLAYCLNLSGNHLICVLWLDSFGGSLESVPCGVNDIGLFTL